MRAATSISSRRPASRTSAAWACSTSASGVPRSTATAMPWANRDTSGSPVRRGQPVEGDADRLAGADVGEHRGRGRRTARRRCGVRPGRARPPGSPRRRPRGRAARRRSGTRRGSGARAPVHLAGQVVVAGEHADRRTPISAQQHERQRRRRGAASALSSDVRRGDARSRPAPTPPARPGTRARSCRGRRARAGGVRRRRRRAPARPRRRPTRSTGPKTPGRGRGRRRRGPGRVVDLRQVADVGQHPHRRAAAAGSPSTRDDDEQQPEPGTSRRARLPTPPGVTTGSAVRRAAGRSASSAGRRPGRAPAPTTSTTTPAGEA